MSFIETLHREHLERLARIEQKVAEKRQRERVRFSVPAVPFEAVSIKVEYSPPPWSTQFPEILQPNPRKPRIENIQRAVCMHFNVTRVDMLSARRTANVVRPRQVAMYLCKQITLKSLPEIGRNFGGRDHTTVLHAVRKIAGLIKDDIGLANEVAHLRGCFEEIT